MTECTGGQKDLSKLPSTYQVPYKREGGGEGWSVVSTLVILVFLYLPHQRDPFSSHHSLLYRGTNRAVVWCQ